MMMMMMIVGGMNTYVTPHRNWHRVPDTQDEVTSQNLRPRYDRHFVGITWHNVCSYKAKLHGVI